VGRELVRMLVRAGTRPRVLVRDPDRLDADLRDHVDPVVTDLSDPDAVVAGTAGVDALYWVAPAPRADDPVAAYAVLGDTVARAVTENTIPRTVFQSSVGAERRHGVGEIDGLARIEERLDATGASVLHLRCGYFFSNLAMDLDSLRRGVVSVILPVDAPLPWVAPRDIAEVAALWLLSPDWTGRHVRAVHGPEDLSWAEVATIVTEAVGRPVRAERIADEELATRLSGAGLGPQQVESIMGMSTGLRDGYVPDPARTVLSTTPTTLRAWVYDVLRPLLTD
jgi:uncharacterized protein YbjT (DUF2867 family)